MKWVENFLENIVLPFFVRRSFTVVIDVIENGDEFTEPVIFAFGSLVSASFTDTTKFYLLFGKKFFSAR